MSFDNLTMTSVSLHSGALKGTTSLGRLPSLPSTSQYLDTSNNSEKVQPRTNTNPTNNNNDDTQGDPNRKASVRATMPSPRKSVEFILHPPPTKRTKLDTAWTAKQVVDAISTSIAPHERLEAIQKTKEALDHDSQRQHDEEIAAGADSVLVKHLAFILTASKANLDNDSNEMTMTELSLSLECLELLYRASSVIVGASFRRMGPMVLELLKTIVTDEITRRTKRVVTPNPPTPAPQESSASSSASDGPSLSDEAETEQASPPPQEHFEFLVGSPEGDLILKKAMRIFGHFARVGEATMPMANFPGFVEGLVHIVTLQPYDNLPWEARLSALWCIANLACNGDNMTKMARSPGLIEGLIAISHRPLPHEANVEHTMEVLRARSIASRALLNLSWSPDNKAPMAANTDLLDVLTELILRRNVPNAPLMKSRTVRDIVATTRRHAVGALRNLAAASRYTKVNLCSYKDGHILDVLTEAALNDPDQSTVDRAFAAIHNLANHDTAVKIVSHPALVMALKDVLMSSDASEQQEGTPRSHAAATLMVLERSISSDMPEYENLKSLLEAMNPENNRCNDMQDMSNGMEDVEATAV